MMNRTLIKDLYTEVRIFNSRAIISILLGLLLVLILLGRLFLLQVVDYQHYETLSDNNRMLQITESPNRGLIYDRHGQVLAENRPSFSLDIIPEDIDDLDTTIESLSKLINITDHDRKQFTKALKYRKPFESVSLRTNLTEQEVATLSVNLFRFPGVDFRARLSRYYPQGNSAVHVIGYVGRINENELQFADPKQYSGNSYIGKVGLERYYEDELRGKVGFKRVEINVEGRVLRVLEKTPPVPGNDIILNLDAGLQSTAEFAMGDNNGAVVAIDPDTGAVLASVSMPIYDPNQFVHGISSKAYKALQKSSDRPQFNRAISGQYPPGSTLKPFVGLGGIDYGSIGIHEEIECTGYYLLPNEERKYRDWKRTGHGHTDLKKALEQSCDVYFYELAYRMGIDRIHSFLQPFGFGALTKLDTTGERKGLLPSREWKKKNRRKIWYPGETLITGIGQGYMLTTPLQLASATATLASRGKRMQPQLLKSVRNNQTGETRELSPVNVGNIKLRQSSNWSKVIRGMKSVVHGVTGTARSISYGLTYKMAGKTGTAQVFGIAQDAEYDAEKLAKKLRDHALFIAFAPVKNPKIAVAVIVENGGSGGRVAAPIARQVIDHYLHKTYGKNIH